MKYLDDLRKKPVTERKRIVWIATGSAVVIILLVSIFLTKEWQIPSLNLQDNADLAELGERTKNISQEFQATMSEYEAAKEKAKQSGQEELAAELEIPTKIKNDVAVSFLKWEQETDNGIALWSVVNNSEFEVLLEDFYLYQGTEGTSSSRTVTVAPGQEKEFEILFPLSSEIATGIEIRKVTFSKNEADPELANQEWSYLFIITPESSAEENLNDKEGEREDEKENGEEAAAETEE
jgi:hypothetical protein